MKNLWPLGFLISPLLFSSSFTTPLYAKILFLQFWIALGLISFLKTPIKLNRLVLSFLPVLTWAALSSFWTTDPSLSWTGAYWRGTGLYFYFSLLIGLILLTSLEAPKEKIQKGFIYLSSFIALCTSGQTLLFTKSGSTFFTGNQNATAFILASAFFYLLRSKLTSNKYFNAFIGSTLILGIIASGSRASLFGLLLCLGIYFLYIKRPKLKTLLSWLAGLFGLLAIYQFLIDTNFLNALLNRSSTFHRLDIWKGSFAAFLEKPLLGWGFHGLYEGFWNNFPSTLTGDIQWIDNAHSLPINILSELGIIGFILALIPIYFLIKGLKSKPEEDRLQWSLYLLFVLIYLLSQPVYIDALVVLVISCLIFNDSTEVFTLPKLTDLPLKVILSLTILFVSAKQANQSLLVQDAKASLDLNRDFRPYWKNFTKQWPFIDPEGSLYLISNRFRDYYADPKSNEGDKKIYANLMMREFENLSKSSIHRPRFIETYGIWNMRGKNFAKADQSFDLLLSKSPENLNIIILKAESAALQNKRTQAITYFEKAESLDSTNINIKMNLGKLYMSLGYKDKAVTKIREASLLAPQNKKIKSILNQF